MSLVFALLHRNYAILAADSRHTRGDGSGTYTNDKGIKTFEIMNGRGVIGFAGEDLGDGIVYDARDRGKLSQPNLRQVVDEVSILAKGKFSLFRGGYVPTVQILIVGFENNSHGELISKAYTLETAYSFEPRSVEFPDGKFEIVGKSGHGALYALHRFGNQDLQEHAALRLSAFVLSEICECDNTVGGEPNIYVIPRDGKCAKIQGQRLASLVQWAKDKGASLGESIMNV